jgi:hypothetical protein
MVKAHPLRVGVIFIGDRPATPRNPFPRHDIQLGELHAPASPQIAATAKISGPGHKIFTYRITADFKVIERLSRPIRAITPTFDQADALRAPIELSC